MNYPVIINASTGFTHINLITVCDLCGRPATQMHHAIVHDMRRYHALLTVPINLMPVCERCHTSLKQTANRHDVRVAFVERQIQRGYDVYGWYRRLPLKVKESWLMKETT